MAFSTLDGSSNYTTSKPVISDNELANNKWYDINSIISSDEWNVFRDNVIELMRETGVTPNGEEDDTVLKRCIAVMVGRATAGQGLSDSESLLDYVESESDNSEYDANMNPIGDTIGFMRILPDGTGWSFKQYSYGQRRDLLLDNPNSNSYANETVHLRNDSQNYKWLEFELEWAGPPWPISNKITVPAKFLVIDQNKDITYNPTRIHGGAVIARDATTSIVVAKFSEDTLYFYKDNTSNSNVVISKIYGLT